MNILNTNSSSHPISNFEEVKEIQCNDCGLIYFVKPSAISSTCNSCGNIAFHPQGTIKNPPSQKEQEIFSPVSLVVDPGTIEELAIQYQQEWQLWAKVTEKFSDLNIHLTYLSFITRNLIFAKAAERYKEHRNHHLSTREDRWQVELADEMLEKISGLCMIQFERHKTLFDPGNLILKKSQVFKLWYVLIGFILMAKIVFYFITVK